MPIMCFFYIHEMDASYICYNPVRMNTPRCVVNMLLPNNATVNVFRCMYSHVFKWYSHP